MARNNQDLQDAIDSGEYEPDHVSRSTVSEWGVVRPTQTRTQRLNEAIASLSQMSATIFEYDARGGSWAYLARDRAKSFLNILDYYNTLFLDYELTPASDDSHDAVYAVPFGAWSDIDDTCNTQGIEAIANQDLHELR